MESDNKFPVNEGHRTFEQQYRLYRGFQSDLDDMGMPTKKETDQAIRRKTMWFFIAMAFLVMGIGGFTHALLPVTFSDTVAKISAALFLLAFILTLGGAATMWRLSKK